MPRTELATDGEASNNALMSRNGADLLIETAEALGITTCFANPGTTELHLVDALGRASSMRTVLTLFEGVASGAADGFARMSGTPALGLFHLGPGYANSLANQHNARRHASPMINLIGDHTTWHRAADAPLHSQIELLVAWTGELFDTESADDAGTTMMQAFNHATTGTGQTATVVLPADAAWSPTEARPPERLASEDASRPDQATLGAAASSLSDRGAIIAGGARLTARSLALLAAIADHTGCKVLLSRTARLEIGTDVAGFDELPYFPEPLTAALSGLTAAVMVGRSEPVTFFGYPDTDSYPLPGDCVRHTIAGHGDDPEPALELLADELGVTATPTARRSAVIDPPSGALTTASIGPVFASAIPEGAVVIGEAVTSGAGYRDVAPSAAPHTLLSILGGAIGGGLPCAVGAAVAVPDRPVLSLQADGSSLYTIQSLWTMARENLDVTVVICANRSYKILAAELERAGMPPTGKAAPLVALDNPAIDFCSLATGFGVASESVADAVSLVAAIARGVAADGPYLIEALMT